MTDLMREHYERLIGFTMKMILEDADGFPMLIFQKGEDEIAAFVSSDEEGNAPGFLFIEPYEK